MVGDPGPGSNRVLARVQKERGQGWRAAGAGCARNHQTNHHTSVALPSDHLKYMFIAYDDLQVRCISCSDHMLKNICNDMWIEHLRTIRKPAMAGALVAQNNAFCKHFVKPNMFVCLELQLHTIKSAVDETGSTSFQDLVEPFRALRWFGQQTELCENQYVETR